MWAKLLDILLPLKSIAQELRHIRQLYELELSERTPPLILPSESPSRYDTEVLVEGLDDRPKSALTKIKEKLFPQEIEDDEFNEMWSTGSDPWGGDAEPERTSAPQQPDQSDSPDPAGSGRE